MTDYTYEIVGYDNKERIVVDYSAPGVPDIKKRIAILDTDPANVRKLIEAQAPVEEWEHGLAREATPVDMDPLVGLNGTVTIPDLQARDKKKQAEDREAARAAREAALGGGRTEGPDDAVVV